MIASLATILVAVRSTDASHFQQMLVERNHEFNGAFRELAVPFRDVSSTDIRAEIAKTKEPLPALAERTDAYIRRFGLYGCEPSAIRKEALKRYSELAEILSGTVSAHRLNHSKGVAFMSANLMAEWLEKKGLRGTSEEKKLVRKTLIAGLLHDCAKGMDEQETEAYLKKHHVRLSEDVIPIKGIHHGPAGRVLARER